MNSFVKLLEFRPGIWTGLIDDLRRRGGGQRESGAFLLGLRSGSQRIVHRWVPYDELDKGSLNSKYVRLGSDAFTALWAICANEHVEVVGDVHTHPRGPAQSFSDRANPMISLAGHVALIVPRFALGEISTADISLNIYQGAGRWQSRYGQDAAAAIHLSQGHRGR